MVKLDQTSQNDSDGQIQKESAWLNEPDNEKRLEQIIENEIKARQRVFDHSPEYKKREIVFGQIQRMQTRLSNLETKVDQILEILKSNNQTKSTSL